MKKVKDDLKRHSKKAKKASQAKSGKKPGQLSPKADNHDSMTKNIVTVVKQLQPKIGEIVKKIIPDHNLNKNKKK